MWYKIENDKIVGVAPKNKKLQDGNLVINYNLNREMLIADGYVEYTGEKNINDLKVVDGNIVEKTDEQLIIEDVISTDERWQGYYSENPDLAVCVRQYKMILDSYNLNYKAKSYDLSAAITGDRTKSDIEKIQLAFTAQSLWNNIILNVESLNIHNPMSWTWENLPKLIEYLPAQEQ